MRRVLALGLGAGLMANGAFMLMASETWYGLVPGVEHSGPFNAHFVRDMGATYLVVAASFVWLAWDASARAAALAGAVFLALHGLIHLAEALADGHLVHLARDLPGVFLPAVAALFLTWPRRAMIINKRGHHESLVDQALDRGV
jgi:hypothetical protein